MNITFAPRSNEHLNNCWNDALARALSDKYTYEQVRKLAKPFMVPDGGLAHGGVEAFLNANEYTTYTFKEPYTVEKVMRLYNHYDNHVVIFTDGHVMYAHSGTIYDNVAPGNERLALNTPVECIMMRAL